MKIESISYVHSDHIYSVYVNVFNAVQYEEQGGLCTYKPVCPPESFFIDSVISPVWADSFWDTQRLIESGPKHKAMNTNK